MFPDSGEKGVFLGKNEIDDGDVDGEIAEVELTQIVSVFFGGEECLCIGPKGCLLKLRDFGLGVAMMIGEGLFTGDGETPILEVDDEGARIADAAERVESAGADF